MSVYRRSVQCCKAVQDRPLVCLDVEYENEVESEHPLSHMPTITENVANFVLL